MPLPAHVAHFLSPPHAPQIWECPKFEIPLPPQFEHLPVPLQTPHLCGRCIGVGVRTAAPCCVLLLGFSFVCTIFELTSIYS